MKAETLAPLVFGLMAAEWLHFMAVGAPRTHKRLGFTQAGQRKRREPPLGPPTQPKRSLWRSGGNRAGRCCVMRARVFPREIHLSSSRRPTKRTRCRCFDLIFRRQGQRCAKALPAYSLIGLSFFNSKVTTANTYVNLVKEKGNGRCRWCGVRRGAICLMYLLCITNCRAGSPAVSAYPRLGKSQNGSPQHGPASTSSCAGPR